VQGTLRRSIRKDRPHHAEDPGHHGGTNDQDQEAAHAPSLLTPCLDVGRLRCENLAQHDARRHDQPAAYLTANATSRSLATSCASSARRFFVGPTGVHSAAVRTKKKKGKKHGNDGTEGEW
jgi:hypothetical protein